MIENIESIKSEITDEPHDDKWSSTRVFSAEACGVHDHVSTTGLGAHT